MPTQEFMNFIFVQFLSPNDILQSNNSMVGQASWHKEWLQDLLIVWGLSRGHNVREAGRLLQTLTLKVQELEMEQQMVLECILRLAKALYEYGTSNYKAVCQLLGPDSSCSKFKVRQTID
jgi:hypothetical protein